MPEARGQKPRKIELQAEPPKTWTKWRIIRLVVFGLIVGILLPFFVADRLRGSLPSPSSKSTKTNTMVVQPTMPIYELQVASKSATAAQNTTASPLATATVTPKPTRVITPKVITPTRVPEFSDTDVLLAINSYRTTHQIHQLVEESHLCQYAAKRAQDLRELGTLDNHAGFNADFANTNSLPEILKGYPGNNLGEDLASQYCINMKTKESFVATTPTALIEWCFDSSTKGHRESLLNDKYNNACIRHANNMYVVILGD